MKNKAAITFIAMTMFANALPDYTVYYTIPEGENRNSPEEIEQIRNELRLCISNYSTEVELDKCIAIKDKLHKDNPNL